MSLAHGRWGGERSPSLVQAQMPLGGGPGLFRGEAASDALAQIHFSYGRYPI